VRIQKPDNCHLYGTTLYTSLAQYGSSEGEGDDKVYRCQKHESPAATGLRDYQMLLGDEKYTASHSAVQDRLDAEREQRIEHLRLELLAAIETDERHSLWKRFKAEIGRRSQAAIARLERDRGLVR